MSKLLVTHVIFVGIPTSSGDQKSLIDLNDSATGGNVDVLNTKFSAMCKLNF